MSFFHIKALEGDGSGWDDLGLGSDDDNEEPDKWSSEDKELLTPSVNLIKAAKVCLAVIFRPLKFNTLN